MQSLFIAWYEFGRKYEAMKNTTPATSGELTGSPMDDQRINREGSDLRANPWLNGVVMLALGVAALNHGVHAWDGGSRLAAMLAILNIACIYLLSLNIGRRQRKN